MSVRMVWASGKRCCCVMGCRPSSAMPTISTFYGITISMYWADHGLPHFHVRYGEAAATIDIRERSIVEGTLPRRVLRLTLEWTGLHTAELLEDWELCATHRTPKPISPLD